MLKLKKVAITGGLSCGKSSACRFFKELGAHVTSADEIVHNLLSTQTSVGQQVISLLGQDIVVNGQIDRRKIATKVFNNQTQLKSLEKLLHPAVLIEIEKQYQQIRSQGVSQNHVALFVAEIPLLFEIGSDKFFDFTIAVHADPESCKQRFKQATGYGEEEYNRRMAMQMPPEEKIKRATFVLENSGDLEQLRKDVAILYNKLISSIIIS